MAKQTAGCFWEGGFGCREALCRTDLPYWAALEGSAAYSPPRSMSRDRSWPGEMVDIAIGCRSARHGGEDVAA